MISLNGNEKKRVLDTLRFMTEHPECGYREWKCSEYVEKQFRALGYKPVTAGNIPGFYVKVETGRSGPCVLVLGELDAVKCLAHPEADPETAAVHACGHNAQSASLVGVAAGLARGEVLERLSGSIILCAVPAEELIEREFRDSLIEKGTVRYRTGKAEFLYRGYFDGVDLSFMVHTSNALACGAGAVGIIDKEVIYKGRAAHAGGSPELGINALYAATLGLSAINSIRETFTENDIVRVHPIITDGGTVVNGIPARARIESFVRAKTYEALKRTNDKVNRALVGAALSLGANVEIVDAPGYAPLSNDREMIDIARRAAERVYTKTEFYYHPSYSSGSTDMGDLSMLIPCVHPFAPGAEGTTHGEDYTIADPNLACVKCAEWQLEMLDILLSDGAVEAQRIKNAYTPAFESKEAYFNYLDGLCSSGDRITYTDEGAEIILK